MCKNKYIYYFYPFDEEMYNSVYSIESTNVVPSHLSDAEENQRKNVSCVLEERVMYISVEERITFFCIFVLIYIVACVGNIAAIVVTSKRKHRHIQKTCVISLALSDLITATVLAIWYLKMFTQRTIVWTLGSFMCSFLPSVPIFGIVCSCTALVGIALDRYRNVVHALSRRWNPEPWICILSAISIWCFSIGVAYPMTMFFETQPIIVISFDEEEQKINFEDAELCLTFKKTKLKTYYICLMCLVFLPLLCIFLWFYYKIAQLIWHHRKPLSQLFQKKYEPSVTVETSTSQIRQSAEYSKTSSHSEPNVKPVVKKRNAQIQRKVRTFKIIVFLMFIFIILRLPNWLYETIKLSYKLDSHAMWVSKYVCIALVLLHCSLNPFLYTFLNQTLDLFKKITTTLKDFVCEVCCCCLSNTEFEEFENENSFVREHFEKQCRNGCDNPVSHKINQKNSRIKFEDLSVVKLYDKEAAVAHSESYKTIKDSKRSDS